MTPRPYAPETRSVPKNIPVPTSCKDSDGDRILLDINGNYINLARCMHATEDEGETAYCDELRAFGKCKKGLK